MIKGKEVKCPVCRLNFELEDFLKIGETTTCPSCDNDLRIIGLDPPRVEVARFLYRKDDDNYYEDEEEEDS